MREYYCREIIDDTQVHIDTEEVRVDALYLTSNGELAARLLRQGAAVLAVLSERTDSDDGSESEVDINKDRLLGVPYACEGRKDVDRDYCEMIYRRYRDIPWDICETKRLFIRETTLEDVDAFWEIYKAPGITEFTEGLYPTIEEERAYQRDYIDKIYHFYGVGVWTLEHKETGEIIGRAGLSYRTLGEDYEYSDCPELGFLIATPYQRQGYALEACSAIIDFARQELDCRGVTALVQPDNLPSLELCFKLKMQQVGHVRIEKNDHKIMYIDF